MAFQKAPRPPRAAYLCSGSHGACLVILETETEALDEDSVRCSVKTPGSFPFPRQGCLVLGLRETPAKRGIPRLPEGSNSLATSEPPPK